MRRSTPEALLPRSDSLDPATTCRGITSNGRPCRRALGPSDEPGAAAFYCWQHKDQAASASTSVHHTAHTTAQPNQRTSIDTLMERLDINDPQAAAPAKKKKPSLLRRLICCCFDVLSPEDLSPPSKPVQHHHQQQQYHRPTASKPSGLGHGSGNRTWIPTTLSQTATTNLLTELDKPISDADEDGYIYMFWVTPETTTRSAPPPAEIGSQLLASANLPDQLRIIGDAIRAAQEHNALASNPGAQNPAGSVRLKIGRTNNVHRRINEWTKQCSHDLTLLRYYPYTPGSGSSEPPSKDGTGLKTPYVHRVERLIHVELGDIRIRDMGPCPDCGKEHKEWFEVPATKEALQWVDGCIRRWCKWAETQKRKNRR